MNEPDRSLSRRQEKKLLRAAAEVTRTEFDNPTRAGCPGSEVLDFLARRDPSLPETPELIEHIATCSQCFTEYSRFRAVHKRRILSRYSLAFAAVVLVISVAAVRLLQRTPPTSSAPANDVARSTPRPQDPALPIPVAPSAVTVNLAPFSPTRGNENFGMKIELPPKLLRVTFLLPLGMEPGEYQVRLQDSTGAPFIDTKRNAKLHDGIASLEIDLDLTGASRRGFTFMIRPSGLSWRTFPVVVQ
jgi:hypothetical protein